MASAGRDALTECREIIKRARTYRAHADGCGAGVGRVATTGPHRMTTGMQHAKTGPHYQTTGLQRTTTSRQLATTGPQRATTGTGVKKKKGRRWVRELKKKNGRRWVCNARRQVQGRATMGAAQATTAEIARQRLRSGDDGSDPARTRRGHSI